MLVAVFMFTTALLSLFTATKKLTDNRWKINLSDGVHSTAAIVASQLVHLASSGELREGTVVDIRDTVVHHVESKHFVFVLSIEIVAQGVPKIGNPVERKVGAGGGVEPSTAGPVQPAWQQQAGAPYNNNGAGQYGAPNPAPAPQPYGGYGAPNAYGAPPPMGNNFTAMGYGGGPPAQGVPKPYDAPPPNPYGSPQQQKPQQYQGGPPPVSNAYGAPAMPPQYRPAAGGAIARNEAPPNLVPISSLNAFNNKWTIKARVTQKSEIRRYSNARGEGKFFSFDLLDAENGEIRVVGWNTECDRFFDQVQIGTVYTLTKASLRNKRSNYNQTRHHFEIHLESGSILTPVEDENAIPKISFSFVPLAALEDTPPGVVLDVIAVVESIADPMEISRKDGTQVAKRSVNIRDASGRSIELTLWGGYTSNPGDKIGAAVASGHHPIVAVKGARVGDFNGKTLSTVSSSTVLLDPVDPPEAGQLRSWYDNGGAAQAAQALSMARTGGGRVDRRVSVAQIKGERLGSDGKAAWVQVLAQVAFVRNESYAYPACPLPYNGKQCSKKLTDQTGDGTSWLCERCHASVPAPDWRYILSLQVADHTEASWVTAFNEVGPELMGMPAQELKALADAGDSRFPIAFRDVQFRLMAFKLKISEETYNDETKMRSTVVRVDPVDYSQETQWTLNAINRLERGDSAYPEVTSSGAGGPAPAAGGLPAGGYGHAAPYGGDYGYGGGGGAGNPHGMYGGGAAGNAIAGSGYTGGYYQGGGGYGGGYGTGYGAPQQQPQRHGGYGGGGF